MNDRRMTDLVQRAGTLVGQMREPGRPPEARFDMLDELDAVVDAIGWELVAREERGECSRRS